jgi:large subunit ribosomal protein L6
MDGEKVFVHCANEQRTFRALQGLTRSLIANMVTGVTQGFEKKLEIVGVGFRADLQGSTLKLTLGYSHPILYPVPKGIKVEVEKQTLITVKGLISNRWVLSLHNFVPLSRLNPTKERE